MICSGDINSYCLKQRMCPEIDAISKFKKADANILKFVFYIPFPSSYTKSRRRTAYHHIITLASSLKYPKNSQRKR